MLQLLVVLLPVLLLLHSANSVPFELDASLSVSHVVTQETFATSPEQPSRRNKRGILQGVLLLNVLGGVPVPFLG